MSDWSEPGPNEDNEEDEIFVGYFEDSEALQQEDEPNTNDPRFARPIGVYHNLGQTDQKPTFLSLRLTEIPIPPRAPKGEGTKQYVLPEPVFEADLSLPKTKQEPSEPVRDKSLCQSGKLSADKVLEIVEHDPIVFFRGSSIPLFTDFAERVLPISNPMGPAPSRFRNDDQEQTTRTVANENNDVNGSTSDPNPKFSGSTETQAGFSMNKVSTKEKAQLKTDLPT